MNGWYHLQGFGGGTFHAHASQFTAVKVGGARSDSPEPWERWWIEVKFDGAWHTLADRDGTETEDQMRRLAEEIMQFHNTSPRPKET